MFIYGWLIVDKNVTNTHEYVIIIKLVRLII